MSKISEENIIRILSRLDVPGNAAKIYIFLLKNGPSTGYAVSKRSGVNNAVVYRELERLKNRNLVYQLGVKPLKYEAINMDGLLKNLKKQNKTEEKLLEKSVIDLIEPSTLSPMLYLFSNSSHGLGFVCLRPNEILLFSLSNSRIITLIFSSRVTTLDG